MSKKTGTRSRFWAFCPAPRSDAARLQWLHDTAPAAGAAAGGDAALATELLLSAAAACDWGRCCPAFNWFGMPEGDLPGWQLAHLEPDTAAVGGQRLVLVPFGRFSSGVASFRAALRAGLVQPAPRSYLIELVRLYRVASRSTVRPPLRARAGGATSPVGTPAPAR